MSRSFRAPEKEMPGAMKQRQQQMVVSFRNSVTREKEEELGLFLEMRKREKEHHALLLQNTEEELDSSLELKSGNAPIFSILSATTLRKTGADEFLNSENDKNDYDWLLTPPGTPLFPSLEMESQKTIKIQNGAPTAHPNALKSTRLSNIQREATGRKNLVSKLRAASPGPSAGLRRPSSSGGSGSRPYTPTDRPPSSKTLSNSVSKTSTMSKPTSTTPCRPSRSSTPKPMPRSSTPTTRASTPTRITRNTAQSASGITKTTAHLASGITKSTAQPASSITKNTAQSCANSPNTRPRPWKPQEMPGYTLDAPPNLKTSLPDRPMRGRAGAPSSQSSSIEPIPNGRVRRQSCSPSRGRLPNGVNRMSGSSVPVNSLNRAYAKANDNVSPGLYGAKMVERLISMRKLVPPMQDDKISPQSKFASPDSSGFGRSFSKKSFDMAMRHMDIRRAVPGNLRPLMTKIPASSMCSVRSGPGPGPRLRPEPTRNRKVSVPDSPLATSSNASSEVSVSNNLPGVNIDDESNSEKGVGSPASIHGR